MSVSESFVFLFPGQGSQKVGMGKTLADSYPTAREAFEIADDVLGFGLSRLCWEGPEEELQQTANTQPAILTVSVAACRVLQERGCHPLKVAGHSLGEYSALVAAGALSLEDALLLVRRRGELMQQAVPVGVGAMAAILGLGSEEVEQLVTDATTDAEVVEVANYNAPEQAVIAGHAPAVERAVEAAREAGARRSVTLPVSAPFHCQLMTPARDAMEPLLESVDFSDPTVPVVCNVDAVEVTTAEEARDALVRQIDSPVRWVESIRQLAVGLDEPIWVEVGPGSVLSGLARRILGVRPLSVGEAEDIDRLERAIEQRQEEA